MDYCHNHPLFLLNIILFLFFFSNSIFLQNHGQLLPITNERQGNASHIQTYIVYVEKPPGSKFFSDEDLEDWHRSFLPNTTLDSGEPRLVYSYREAISGFAARLTLDEVRAMEAMEGFLEAEPDDRIELRTTYTPTFLGLSSWSGLWVDTSFGEGIIIGVLDSGALGRHKSFEDKGMPPRPQAPKWKGRCEYRRPICNNKLIAARAFRGARRPSPTDKDGHGTHVASTAAGNFVDDAEVLGNAMGRASGIAPKAHLAIYKVCHGNKIGCPNSDVLAGIDQAIHDGVDIISMSLGGASIPIFDSAVAKASFSAIEKGIFACAAAGNDGPFKSVLDNDAPWLMTVGASTTDRRIKAMVKLGNGTELYGETAYQPGTFNPTMLPIVFPGLKGQNGTQGCRNDSFSNIDINGTIVLCVIGYNISDIEKGENVKKAGGTAMIILNHFVREYTTFAQAHVLPAVHVSYYDAKKIVKYFRTASTPTAMILFNGTQFGYRPSPAVATFSSRGPSLMNGGILKPDIIAPGVNILAAWPFTVGPNGSTSSTSNSAFNFLSGTSMATPHVSGIVALLKKNHPQWSVAAIKSAIMTSASPQDRFGDNIVDEIDNETASLYAMGAGQVDPIAANDPGLIYDLNSSDYIPYLCGLNFTDKQVNIITKHSIQCSNVQAIEAYQLNYPSISVSLESNSNNSKIIRRNVTNVGDANSDYSIYVNEPMGVKVDVSPGRLQFSGVDQVKGFEVEFSIQGTPPSNNVSEGYLSWISSKNYVRSPIFVTFT